MFASQTGSDSNNLCVEGVGAYQDRVCRGVQANVGYMPQGQVAWRGHWLPEGNTLLEVAPAVTY